MLQRSDLDYVFERTAGLWPALDGERIFITGGTGFVGKWLLETLLHSTAQAGIELRVTALTRSLERLETASPHLANSPRIDWVEGDVRDFAFPTGNHRFVIHAATDVLDVSSQLEVFNTCVEGTRRVLDFAAAVGCKTLLLTSSGAVYGRQPPDVPRVAETAPGLADPADARSAYGLGKLCSEWLVREQGAAVGIDARIARCFAFIGPYLALDRHFAIGNFIRDAMAGRCIEIKGDGTPLRSYLYAADLAVWLWHILLAAPPRSIYNVGSADGRPLGEIAGIVAGVLSPGKPPLILQAPKPGVPAERYVPDVGKIADELKLVPEIGLEEAIARTAAWHRKPEHPDEQ
jgi:nucleoside-diphosphate-sugar epimerase